MEGLSRVVLIKKKLGLTARNRDSLSGANKLFLLCSAACLCLPLVEALSSSSYVRQAPSLTEDVLQVPDLRPQILQSQCKRMY